MGPVDKENAKKSEEKGEIPDPFFKRVPAFVVLDLAVGQKHGDPIEQNDNEQQSYEGNDIPAEERHQSIGYFFPVD